jgi:hypothetical protein
MSTNATILGLAEELRLIADEISYNAFDTTSEYHKRGTIIKALPEEQQDRFNPQSLWVSLGDGTYKHLNGKKGLVTTHSRLADVTSVVFEA